MCRSCYIAVKQHLLYDFIHYKTIFIIIAYKINKYFRYVIYEEQFFYFFYWVECDVFHIIASLAVSECSRPCWLPRLSDSSPSVRWARGVKTPVQRHQAMDVHSGEGDTIPPPTVTLPTFHAYASLYIIVTTSYQL